MSNTFRKKLVVYAILLMIVEHAFCLEGNVITDSLFQVLQKSRKKSEILNAVAQEYTYIRETMAMEISGEALKAAKKENNRLEQANAYYIMAITKISVYQYDSARRLLDKSKQIYNELNYHKGLIKYKYALATISFLQGDIGKSFKIYNERLVNLSAEDSCELQLVAYIGIGRIKWIQGYPDPALDYYKRAITLAVQLKNTQAEAMIYLLTGIAYQDMGYYELAMENLQKSLTIIETMNYHVKLPYALHYLGVVYFELYDYDKSSDYFQRALAVAEQHSDTWGKALIYRYIGRIHNFRGQYDSAFYYFNESLSLATKINDRIGELYSRRFLGEVYLEKGQYKKALTIFRENIMAAGLNMNRWEIVCNLYDIGRVYEQQGNHDEAIRYYSQSKAIADSLKLFYDNLIACKKLAALFENRHDYRNALYYYKQVKTYSDTIFSDRKRKNIEELLIRYETQKKNNEITRLKLDQVEQQSRLQRQRLLSYSLIGGFILVSAIVIVLIYFYNQKLKSDHEKEILIREIHHRVKNNLQTISSLLSLQGSYISDAGIKDLVTESQGRVKSMALIHQLLYQQEKLSRINFEQYITRLIDAVSSSYSKPSDHIRCIVNCQQIYLDIETAIPIGLIANELLVNAYKHAFKGIDREGLIHIEIIRQENNGYCFSIHDNGIGIPGRIDFENSGTLGLKLVYILVRQIKGILSYDVKNGTEFKIFFSESEKKIV